MRQQARWLDLLGEFDFYVEYRPGYRRGNADALSRRSCRSCAFCREPRERECLATFTSPETQPDDDDRWAAEPLGRAQRADQELKTVIDWRVVSDERPSCEEVKRHGGEVKEYWSQWEMLDLNEGVIYRRWVSGDGRLQWLQVIPPVG